eukprot:2687764-Ditylum_brightwellii.AAC.4
MAKSGTENDVLEQNKSDEQQITTEGENDIEDGMETVKEKINTEPKNNDEEEDNSEDNLSSSLLEEGDSITHKEEFQKLTKPAMSINVTICKQKLLALCNTLPRDLGESKHQE